MKTNNQQLAIVLLIIVLIGNPFKNQVFSQTSIPETGTYDGKIGEDQLILVAENTDSALLKGYFVQNRGKAVEDSHVFSFHHSTFIPIFQSDLYVGKLKSAKITPTTIAGKLTLLNKRKFIFWHPKVDVSFTRREEPEIITNNRYKDETFPTYEVKSDLLYGKAKGYWTSSPYSDAPYIEVLGKGLIKAFKDPELLDLKLDIYYPKTDLFKNRPLVMLIHGGAFYIGSKESAAEKALAATLAKRGYVVASIDYRLGFKLLASDVEMSAYRAIQDAHAALRFLAHNAKGLGINPEQIYVGGTSAGGVASLNVAFMKNEERPDRILEAEKSGQVSKIEASGNKYTESFQIKAVANLWGAVSNPEIIDKDEKISVISVHGTADNIVPFDYDYPFQKMKGVNRLVMDKMYGSKPIHDRLQILGHRNRLVALDGLDHEPELETYNTLNHYMDTVINHVARFFYEETAPNVFLPPSQLTVSESANLRPVYYEVNNGTPVRVTATGGVKTNADPIDASIIWIRNTDKRQFNVLTNNEFEAWNLVSFPVVISR